MLKNNFLVLILLCAIAFGATTSCRKDRNDDPVDPTTPTAPDEPGARMAVNLIADILPASTLKVANDSWEANDRVGLFMKRAGQALTAQSAVYSEANNLQMSIQSGTLVSYPTLIYPESDNVDFIAYHPYNASVGAEFTIPLNLSEQSDGLPEEVLYSNNIANQGATAQALKLDFKYSLAKVEITVTGGTNSNLTYFDFAEMTVTVEGLYTQATLQLANGTLTGISEKQPVTLRKKSSNTTSATFEMLALPSNETVTFKFNDKGLIHSYEMTIDFEAAKMYNYNFAIDFPSSTFHAALQNTFIVPREVGIAQNISVGANTDGFWTRKADFGGTGRSSAVSFSIGNKGYVGIGHTASSGALPGEPIILYHRKDFWEYDPATDVWTQKADFPENRSSAVGFSIGDKGYVGMGDYVYVDATPGVGGSYYYNYQDFWEYDPVSNVWTQKADFAGGLRSHAVGFSIGNKGYVGTGTDGGDYSQYDGSISGGQSYQDFWEYDPVSNVWTQKADFGGGGRSRAVGFSIGNKGYCGFWEFDPISNVWTKKADIAGATNGAVGFSIGGRGYVGLVSYGFMSGWGFSYYMTEEFWEFTP